MTQVAGGIRLRGMSAERRSHVVLEFFITRRSIIFPLSRRVQYSLGHMFYRFKFKVSIFKTRLQHKHINSRNGPSYLNQNHRARF